MYVPECYQGPYVSVGHDNYDEVDVLQGPKVQRQLTALDLAHALNGGNYFLPFPSSCLNIIGWSKLPNLVLASSHVLM